MATDRNDPNRIPGELCPIGGSAALFPAVTIGSSCLLRAREIEGTIRMKDVTIEREDSKTHLTISLMKSKTDRLSTS